MTQRLSLRRVAIVVLPVLLILAWVAINYSREDAVAILIQKDGKVNRDHAKSKEVWQKAKPGSTFYFGDAIQTLNKASAIVRIGHKGKIQLAQDTTVRFLRNKKGNAQPRISIDQGSAEIVSGELGLNIRTLRGALLVPPTARIRIPVSYTHLTLPTR